MALKRKHTPPMIVECMGELFRISKRRWRLFLEARIRGEDVDLEDFGTRLGHISHDVTDWDDEEFKHRWRAAKDNP